MAITNFGDEEDRYPFRLLFRWSGAGEDHLGPMPAHNYMLEDVLGVLRAIFIFPLFVVAPGYVAAWFGNLFGFRGRTLSFRLAFSAPLSISICPILTFLTGTFASI